MKIEFHEWEHGASVELTPETVKDFAQLARFAKNAKAEKPTFYMNISGNEPYLNIFMEKVKKSVQKNSITPNQK